MNEDVTLQFNLPAAKRLRIRSKMDLELAQLMDELLKEVC